MTEFFQNIVTIIQTVIQTIADTAKNIDGIKFEGTAFSDWLGYARYGMGSPLYTLFTVVILISIGISIWTFLLKGISYLKSILPW